MKKTSKTVQWIFTAIFGICALANGFHFSTLLLLLATILLMPIEPIRNFLKDKAKIKSGIAVALAIILFFIGILSSPLADAPPDQYDNSSISSTVSDDKDSITETSSSDTSSDETLSKEQSSSSDTTSSSQSQETSSVGTGTATAVNPLNIPVSYIRI